MTEYIDFQPPVNGGFQFQATLDGQPYTCLVTWNLFGQRWYIACRNLAGALVFSLPLIGSPLGQDISLSAGYFTTKLVYRAPTNQFEVG